MTKLCAAVLAASMWFISGQTALAYQTDVRRQQDERSDWWIEVKRERAVLRREMESREDVGVETAPAGEVRAVAGCLSAAQVASYARAAGFPEDVIPTMVTIAYRESHYCPGAVNDSSGACGLWQMYPCPGPEALDPATNARMAYSKYQASGLAPWGY